MKIALLELLKELKNGNDNWTRRLYVRIHPLYGKTFFRGMAKNNASRESGSQYGVLSASAVYSGILV